MSNEQSKKICPVAALLALVNKKHMLSIVYVLRNTRLGFNELQEASHINTATLTVRLRELEQAGMVSTQTCANDSRQRYYQLTKRGEKLSAVLAMFATI